MATDQYKDSGPGTPFKRYKQKEQSNIDISTPSEVYKSMHEAWELPMNLRGGTLKMRSQGRKWLPQEPKESNKAYENRLARTVCFGAFNRTVSTLAGLPFMRPITVEHIPKELEYLLTNADGNGRDLTSFAHSLLTSEIELGITHILVDAPYFEGSITIKEQETLNIRPYLIPISAEDIIGWTSEMVGGVTKLTSIRISEFVTVQGDHYSEVKIPQVRVVLNDSIQLMRQDSNGAWYLHQEMPNSFGMIPLIPLYGKYDGFMQGKPPLEDLCWLNLKHYQKQSDVDNIEHVANVPILFGSGFDAGEMDGIEIGPNRLIVGPEGSSLEYVEHSGVATGGSRESLKSLEGQMAAMGADLIIRKSVDRQTAKARAIDQSESVAMLQIMVNNLETGLETAIKLAGKALVVDVSEDLQVDAGDYLSTPSGANLLDILAQMLIENDGMSIEDAQAELKRRGVLSDVFKIGKRENLNKNTEEDNTNNTEM